MSEFSIKDGLEVLNSNELIKLIMNLIQREGQARLHVLEWLEQNCDINKKASNSNKKSKSPKIHDELLFEYWNNAQSIISEFNCYGGGPEEEEEEVYEWLEKISDLIKEDKITPEAKHRFMEEAFVEYDDGNSGFDDGLMDLFFELCKEKDEWEFLDKDHLESIAEIAMQRKNDESYVLERLFTFYKNGDYEKAKEKLILVYKTTHHKRYFEEYKRMKKYLSESDWEKIEPEIMNEAQNNNLHDYLSICLQKGMKDIVIKTIISPPVNQWGYASVSDFDIFAQKLEEEYPKEILEYYYKKAYRRIPNGDRKTYKEAVKYLGKVKAIYLKHLKDKDGWTHMLSKLLMEFKKRPAFIDEVKKSKL